MSELKEKINELGLSLSEFKAAQNERIDDLEKVLNRPTFKDSKGNKKPEGGGVSLDEKGNIKLYNPKQSFLADNKDTEYGDVDLGAFLRSAVDKPKTDNEIDLLSKSTGSSGIELPTRISRELIDKLRAANPVIGAGARSISLEGADSTKFIKINSDPDSVWHTELDEESFSDPSFGAVSLEPKTVLCLTELSREVLQDSANLEQALTSAFVGSLNDGILNATFTGSAANEPTGLATQISQTEEYSNGGDPDWSHFVGANRTLHGNNVPEGNRTHIYAPDVWETLALTSDDNGRYQDAPSFIRNIPNVASSGVSEGEAYAGDFSNVVYGWRLNITLEQFNGPSVRKYASVWLAAARLDVAVFRPKALVRIEEAAGT